MDVICAPMNPTSTSPPQTNPNPTPTPTPTVHRVQQLVNGSWLNVSGTATATVEELVP